MISKRNVRQSHRPGVKVMDVASSKPRVNGAKLSLARPSTLVLIAEVCELLIIGMYRPEINVISIYLTMKDGRVNNIILETKLLLKIMSQHKYSTSLMWSTTLTLPRLYRVRGAS